MYISLADKWSELFHCVLQLEDRVTADIASDALLLIEALHDAWRRAQEQDGYELDPTITAQAQMVLDALEAKSQDKPVTAPWPIGTLQNWELKPPFHAADRSLLKADWNTFKALAARRQAPGPDVSGSPCLWIIAAAVPLRKAWQRVCHVLLAGTCWTIKAVPSLTEIPSVVDKPDGLSLFGSPWDAESQMPLLQSQDVPDALMPAFLPSLIGVGANIHALGEYMRTFWAE